MSDQRLLDIADDLYAVALAQFTPLRDATAKELKAVDPDLAARVKTLKKPSLAAWVVNLLVRRDTAHVDQVLEVGAALRAAQASMAGDDLRELTRQRRQLTAAVTTQARSLAREEGQRITDSVADQIEATLTAAMVDEGCAAAVRSGLLVAALAATGVDEVDLDSAIAVPAALGYAAAPREAPQPVRPDLHVVPDPDADAKALAAAEEEVEEAESAVAEAAAALTSADAAVADLEARSMQIQAEIDEFKRRISALEETAEEVEGELEEAEDARDEAHHAHVAAQAERDRAAASLARMKG